MSHAFKRGLEAFETPAVMSGEAAHEQRATPARWLWCLVRRLGITRYPPGGYFSVRERCHDAENVPDAPLADNPESTCALLFKRCVARRDPIRQHDFD